MHSRLLLVGLGVALLLRWGLTRLRPSPEGQTWARRWQWALSLFWMPPLFLGMTRSRFSRWVIMA
ncbi:MAG: hypothetical protein HC771_09665 [Synechococcales cyanobacterium CRU_2_2]|nr:hypothetical protein [Synechococcales cyanobacterium CRU_2_2]